MVDLKKVVNFIDHLLDVSKEPDQEGNGLAFSARETVAKIGASFNTSSESIDRAGEIGVDLLLVHHTSWDEIDLHLKGNKFRRLKDKTISLYAAHESLDRAPGFGTADTLAALLGLTIEGRCAQGEGVYGTFAVESFSALVALTKAALNGPVESWNNNPKCRNGAIVTGAAGLNKPLLEIQKLGCDTFITGEGSLYTKLFAKEIGVNLIFGSHYATEFPGIKALARKVAEEFGLPGEAIPEDSAIR